MNIQRRKCTSGRKGEWTNARRGCRSVEGKHVLLVDDILDSGKTLTRVRGELQTQMPESIKTCVLLRKKIPSAMEVPCDFVGFDIDDEFVVGYGLDYDGYYRNFPDIGVIEP